MPDQPSLFNIENPLDTRFGKAFFKSLPKAAGIYRMLGAQGEILYVGKAKDLRIRVRSYARLRPGACSRKLIRMIHLVKAIEWEVCADEKAALLRENELLRTLRPPFNVVNTQPNTYYFVAVRFLEGEARFRLTMVPKRQGDTLFGAFKGRKSVERGMQALLRLLWFTQIKPIPERFEFPARLLRYRPPPLYSVALPFEWRQHLKRLLNGTGDALIVAITEKLLERDNVPRFAYGIIQEDLEHIRAFYERCCRRNRELRLRHKLRGRLIEQERLDDLLVVSRLERKNEALATGSLTEDEGPTLEPDEGGELGVDGEPGDDARPGLRVAASSTATGEVRDGRDSLDDFRLNDAQPAKERKRRSDAL